MIVWWYSTKGKRYGPIGNEDLKHLIQSQKLNPETMLWREGMESWRPLSEIDELQALRNAVPPPLPKKILPDPLTYPLATRWPRFFARIFDVWWEELVVSLILSFLIVGLWPSSVEWIGRSGGNWIFGILCIPVVLVLDASIYRVFGNTIGKSLLGLKVTNINGSTLSFTQYVSRNFSMWVEGLCLGIPILCLVTLASQYRYLGKGKQASYDESTDLRVHAKPIHWGRILIMGLAFAGILILIAFFNTYQDTPQRGTKEMDAPKHASWENPITHAYALIDSKWQYSTQTDAEGQQIFMFSEQGDHAGVIFALEEAPGYTLDEYIQAYKKSTASLMRYNDQGRTFTKGQHAFWTATGTMTDRGSNLVNVHIVQTGSGYWRIVAVQMGPYESDAMVEQLRSALWKTIE